MATKKTTTISKLFTILRFQRQEISSIYSYAVFAGLVQLSLPLGIQSIISFVLGGAISTSLILLIIFVILGVFVTGMLQVNQMKIIERIQQQLFTRYAFLYAHTIPRLSMRHINDYYLPELTNRFFDAVSLQKSLSKLLLDVPTATIQILFGLILLSFYHPFFIFFGILLLFILFVIIRFTGNRGLATSLQVSEHKYKVAGFLQESARLITPLKFSRDSGMPVKKTDEYVHSYLQARTAHFRILLSQYWTLIAFKLLIVSSMLIVGSYLLVNQQLNIGQFIAAEIVIIAIIESVEKLIVNLDKVYDTLTSVEKVNKLVDKEKDQEGVHTVQATKGGWSLKLQDVSFGYAPEKPVLRKISFAVAGGEKVCIMGKYGSGKSTLIKLIGGLHVPDTGFVWINDLSVEQYDPRSLRPGMGILTGSREIFEGTIRENICMGAKDVPDEKINQIAAQFGLTPFLEECAGGLDYMLHPQGQHLSERTVKKIMLIRALIHQPKLVMLEDPWLGLEDEFGQAIQDYLLQLKDTTVIVICNDPFFAERCDKTILMESGSVVTIKQRQHGRG